jgi:hypothetical protein
MIVYCLTRPCETPALRHVQAQHSAASPAHDCPLSGPPLCRDCSCASPQCIFRLRSTRTLRLTSRHFPGSSRRAPEPVSGPRGTWPLELDAPPESLSMVPHARAPQAVVLCFRRMGTDGVLFRVSYGNLSLDQLVSLCGPPAWPNLTIRTRTGPPEKRAVTDRPHGRHCVQVHAKPYALCAL